MQLAFVLYLVRPLSPSQAEVAKAAFVDQPMDTQFHGSSDSPAMVVQRSSEGDATLAHMVAKPGVQQSWLSDSCACHILTHFISIRF